MPVNESNQTDMLAASEAHRRRSNLILLVAAVLFVVVPFLFWRGTWFGRPLPDAELEQYLTDQEKPRHGQHALVQIGERIAHGDATVKRFYPQVVALTASPLPEIRVTLAWVMGADTRAEEFHHALIGMLQDTEPLVRRNAALSLVRFGDTSGKVELLAMLRPFTLRSPQGGVMRFRVKAGDSVDNGTVVAELTAGGETPLEIRSPLPGKLASKLVNDGTQVSSGQEILILSPGPEHVWEALRALYLVGGDGDLAEVERYTNGSVAEMSPKIQEQAVSTLAAIRRRSSPAGR